MKIILHWLLLSVAVYVSAFVVNHVSLICTWIGAACPAFISSSHISVSPWWVALIVGAVLMFINVIIKPIITLLTLPITILTLGLFSLVLNGLVFWALALAINGFTVNGFVAALLGSIVVSIINWIGHKIFG